MHPPTHTHTHVQTHTHKHALCMQIMTEDSWPLCVHHTWILRDTLQMRSSVSLLAFAGSMPIIGGLNVDLHSPLLISLMDGRPAVCQLKLCCRHSFDCTQLALWCCHSLTYTWSHACPQTTRSAI